MFTFACFIYHMASILLFTYCLLCGFGTMLGLHDVQRADCPWDVGMVCCCKLVLWVRVLPVGSDQCWRSDESSAMVWRSIHSTSCLLLWRCDVCAMAVCWMCVIYRVLVQYSHTGCGLLGVCQRGQRALIAANSCWGTQPLT